MQDAESPLGLRLQFEEHLRQLQQLADTMSDAKIPATAMTHIALVEDGPRIGAVFASIQENFTTIRSLDRPPYVTPADRQLRTELAKSDVSRRILEPYC